MAQKLLRDRVEWHPGFYGAVELELRKNRDDLVFDREHPLSSKPIVMDLMVIRKRPDAKISNEVGHIFKEYNVWEYKSPTDTLGIDAFYKTLGYACLFKAFGKKENMIPADQITMTLIQNSYPRKLFQILKTTGKVLEKRYPGIYYVSGNIPFPTQIIVSRELDPETHSALRILSDRAKEEDIRRFLEMSDELIQTGEVDNADAVLQASVSANENLYKKIKEDAKMSEALRELMKEELESQRNEGREEGREEGRKEGALDMLISLVKKNLLSIKDAAEQAGLSPEMFQKKMMA